MTDYVSDIRRAAYASRAGHGSGRDGSGCHRQGMPHRSYLPIRWQGSRIGRVQTLDRGFKQRKEERWRKARLHAPTQRQRRVATALERRHPVDWIASTRRACESASSSVPRSTVTPGHRKCQAGSMKVRSASTAGKRTIRAAMHHAWPEKSSLHPRMGESFRLHDTKSLADVLGSRQSIRRCRACGPVTGVEFRQVLFHLLDDLDGALTRFFNTAVKAGIHELLSFWALRSVASEANDYTLETHFTKFECRLRSREIRHLIVHENEVVRRRCTHVHGLLAILSRVERQIERVERGQRERHPEEGVILDQQGPK
mmetsp:Transcript_18315/g.53411  ORF Transcript_18315/g.53411 Transcript_18315/m.53411 type:complete len:313 (+) Transcript_18315:1550-2488(+)